MSEKTLTRYAAERSLRFNHNLLLRAAEWLSLPEAAAVLGIEYNPIFDSILTDHFELEWVEDGDTIKITRRCLEQLWSDIQNYPILDVEEPKHKPHLRKKRPVRKSVSVARQNRRVLQVLECLTRQHANDLAAHYADLYVNISWNKAACHRSKHEIFNIIMPRLYEDEFVTKIEHPKYDRPIWLILPKGRIVATTISRNKAKGLQYEKLPKTRAFYQSSQS